MSKLDHAASLTSSDAAAKQKATLQQRTTHRKPINTGYNVLFLRRKVAKALGIDADPRRGGQDAGVVYVIYPGSGNGKPRQFGEIFGTSKQLFEAWGGLNK